MTFEQIRQRIEKELPRFITHIDKKNRLQQLSPLLLNTLRDFVLREGKRIRPLLFVAAYQGYARKTASGLFTSALAIELLHDFMLVHDDIIDRSDLRRNKPTAHRMFDAYLKRYPGIKCSGTDLAIILGDVMYAAAIYAFLSVREDRYRKEQALRMFTQAAAFTGCGEFIELLYGATQISATKKETIYTIYDYKTSYYSFACPLASGALLAGAPRKDITKLTRFGIILGRAFQIKDDIIGMFSEEIDSGKSSLSDLQESKKTLLLWHTYNGLSSTDKKTVQNILSKRNISRTDLLVMRTLIKKSGALDKTRQEMDQLVESAERILAQIALSDFCKKQLLSYCRKLLA